MRCNGLRRIRWGRFKSAVFVGIIIEELLLVCWDWFESAISVGIRFGEWFWSEFSPFSVVLDEEILVGTDESFWNGVKFVGKSSSSWVMEMSLDLWSEMFLYGKTDSWKITSRETVMQWNEGS